MSNLQQVTLDGNVYYVDVDSIKEAEEGRWICNAYKLREVQNWPRLDELAKLVGGSKAER